MTLAVRMSGQSLVQRAGVWLRSTWHVHVPPAWLDACVEWVQQEAGGPMSQAQVNQQVLEQWLLTDLRDLAHPVLPDSLSQALKVELSGSFCLQVDSLLDVSQPAYSQLQQWKGTDCTNEQVSAVTQATQRPWEAKPTRMLMLRLTDGVQDLEAMEYHPIPALNANLAPGTKMLLQGVIACRLGVLLLKPENVRVLGGEVEELVERNSQGRVLCRVLGLPDESPREGGVQQTGPHRLEEGLSDEELLASVEEDERILASVEMAPDSGYGSRSEVSGSSFQDAASQRQRSLLSGPSARAIPDSAMDGLVTVEPLDEDFDDIPLEELDRVISQQELPPEPNPSRGVRPPCMEVGPSAVTFGSGQRENINERTVSVRPQNGGASLTLEKSTAHSDSRALSQLCPGARNRGAHSEEEVERPGSTASELPHSCAGERGSGGAGVAGRDCADSRRHAVSVGLNSPPFTYLSLLLRESHSVTVVRLKAFIVTLLGRLQSGTGAWQVGATISDGTGYLDVHLSDEVLAGLIGFTVAESKSLKKDVDQRHRVPEGLQNCQRELVDLCCVMTVEYDPARPRAVVQRVDEVTEETCLALEKRVDSHMH